MHYFRLFLLCGILTVVGVSDADARRPDQCGVIDARDAKALYRDANRIWYIFDVREDINHTCRVMEQLEDWRKKREDDFSDAEEDYLDKLEGYVEEEFFSMSDPISIIHAWKEVDTADTIQKAKRIGYIREGKKSLQSVLNDLDLTLGDIIRFSKEKDKALRDAKSAAD